MEPEDEIYLFWSGAMFGLVISSCIWAVVIFVIFQVVC